MFAVKIFTKYTPTAFRGKNFMKSGIVETTPNHTCILL